MPAAAAQFLAIARLAALEAIRRPVFLLVALSSVAGIATALFLYSLAALAATLLAVRAGASDLHLDWTAALPALLALLLAPACAGAWNNRTRRPFTSAAFFLLLTFLLPPSASPPPSQPRSTTSPFPATSPGPS